jgi:hypothetical protein
MNSANFLAPGCRADPRLELSVLYFLDIDTACD